MKTFREWELTHQYQIPLRLTYLANDFPNITWKEARHLYCCAVHETLMELKIKTLSEGLIGLSYYKVKEKFIQKLNERG